MKIAVLDGQGAGLGRSVIRKIRRELPQDVTVIALGTNTLATANMVRAGADIGISGEKGFCAFCRREPVDAIIAPIGVLQPGSIHGEIDERTAHAFIRLTCKKYLIPLHHPDIVIPCTAGIPIKSFIDELIAGIRTDLAKRVERVRIH